MLTPIGVSISGTILEPWASVTANISGGQIMIAGAGTTPLIGSGTLIIIKYQVNPAAEEGQTTPIHFVSVIFNEGDPAASPRVGLFTVITGFNISGAARYYSNDKPIGNAAIILHGYQTITNTDGMFWFTEITGGNYTLTPSKDGELGKSISALDASMILRDVVGLISLTPYQMIAADVSGDVSISAYDASYILRYVVELITEFPVGDDWTFVPTSFPIDETNWNTAPNYLNLI